jgi:membrane-associated protease RseP (regulator of RpoE activity)
MIDLVALIIGAFGVLYVHEIAHVIAARWCGVRVLAVGVGFGPTLFSLIDRRKTRWTVAALPIAGATSFFDRSTRSPEKSLSSSSEYLSDKSIPQRLAIYAAGPIASTGLAGLVGGAILVCYQIGLFSGDLTRPLIAISLLISAFSLWVGVFNLFPIPPLDGARLLFLAFEFVRGRPLTAHSEKYLNRAGLLVMALGESVFIATVVWLSM